MLKFQKHSYNNFVKYIKHYKNIFRKQYLIYIYIYIYIYNEDLLVK